MGLIIDNDVVSRVFVRAEPQFAPLSKAITEGRHKWIHGGRLTRELVRNHAVARLLSEFEQAGLAKLVDPKKVDEIEQNLKDREVCRSNDEHIIALAQVSSARVLCTLDEDLIEDFKDKSLVPNPRGRIYKNQDHRPLVAKACRACCCRVE